MKKCAICKEEFGVKPCCIDSVKTCGKQYCKTELRRITSRKQLLKYGSPSSRKEVAEKISRKTKKAFKEGRMGHMKKVWKDGKKRWQGKGNPRYKEIGSKGNDHGYITIKTKNGWINEERFIVEKFIGRKLKKDETIHHINGIKNDNRIVNLYLMKRKEHKAWHVLDNMNKDLVDNRPKLKSNLNKIK